TRHRPVFLLPPHSIPSETGLLYADFTLPQCPFMAPLRLFYIPFQRQLHQRSRCCFTSTLAANYFNGVDMNWLYLLLVLALMGYLMRALMHRDHE
ncbi:hypothetical protein, partial [Aeromonas media]|uniref:hypothetical protein n=1 Tax=Aeromonas media TaxID=651 RepID=UPI001F11BD62